MADSQENASGSVKLGPVVALVVIIGVVGLVVLSNRTTRSPGSVVAPESGTKETSATPPTDSAGKKPAPAEAVDGETAKRLIGRWLRPDGGYVIEIRGLKPECKLDAGYFNPNPINVSKAEYSVSDGKLFVFVELRDTNYPGATYKLSYDPATERLAGLYHQPLQDQTYEIYFERQQE